MPLNLSPELLNELVRREIQTERPSSSPSTPSKPGATGPMLAALLGGVGDGITTQIGLARGGREANPLNTQNPVGNGLINAGEYIGSALLSKLLTDHGHPALGKLLGYGAGLAGGASTIHNLQVIPKLQK